MVVPSMENPYSANTRKLTPAQRDMLVSLSDKGDKRDKIVLFILHPERFVDLCKLIFFQFVKLEEDHNKQLVACITLPGLYARGLIIQEQQ